MSQRPGLVEIGCGGERVCPGVLRKESEGGCLAARLTNQHNEQAADIDSFGVVYMHMNFLKTKTSSC